MNPNTPRVRATGRSRTTDRSRRVYLTSGSSALAPDELADGGEPVRTRSAEQRAAADARAEQRNALRSGRVDAAARRLRVAPPAPVTVARAPFVAFLCVLVVAGVVGILVLTAKINANQFRLNNLQDQQANLDEQEQTLKQTLAQQQSPGNLVAAAKKLGLVPAGTIAYIQLPNGKVYGLPQPASKVPSVTAQTGAPSAGTPSGAPSGSAGAGTGTGPATTAPAR